MFKCRPYVLLLVLISSTTVLMTGTVQAQEAEEQEKEKEFEALIMMNVEAVSKKEESLLTAPGVISVITANDIKEMGVHTVAEAIGFMTGVFVYDSYFTEFNQIAIRGNFGAEHYNSKVLFLINGHPCYYTTHGGFEMNSVPIEAVERIEVIRGPVSVLYGTNALTGVINVITKKEPAFFNGEVRYQYGSFNTHDLRISLGKTMGDFRYFVSGTYRDQEGYDLVVKPEQDEGNKGLSHKQYMDTRSLFINFGYKDLEVDVAYWHDKVPSKIGIVPHSLFPNEFFKQGFLYADVRYGHDISEDVRLHFNLRLDTCDFYWEPQGIMYLDKTAANPSIAQADNSKYGAEMYADISVSENLNVLAGAMYDQYHSSPYIFSSWCDATGANFSSYKDEKDTSDVAAYANFSYQVSEPLSFVGGLRHTENSASGGHTDFRIGSIIKLKEGLVLKGLYGTSYRSPNFFELYCASVPILSGNENLDFETLDGLDIGLYYNYENVLLTSMTFFWNSTDNFITRRPVAGIPTYVNIKGHELQGIEYELKYQPARGTTLFANYTNIFGSKDLETEMDLEYIIKNMLNFGFSFKPADPLTISSYNMYRSAWADSEAYFVSNLAIYYMLPGYQPSVEVFVTLNNLFDSEYTYAEFSRRKIATIPGGPPRAVTAGVILSF